MADPRATQTGETQGWVDEIHKGVRYGMAATVLEERQSPYQRVTIIDSTAYGRALLLDGCWMTAERQERHYHEALVHPALCGAAGIRSCRSYARLGADVPERLLELDLRPL